MDERNAAASVRPVPPARVELFPASLDPSAPGPAVTVAGEPSAEVEASAEAVGDNEGGGSELNVSGADADLLATASSSLLDAKAIPVPVLAAPAGSARRAAPGDQSNVSSSFAICRLR